MPEENRRIASIRFEGITCPVLPSPVPETFFAFAPPTGAPSLYVDPRLPNEAIIGFVNTWLPQARQVMGYVQKRYRKTSSLACRYQTGDLAYVFGRPFMLRVYPLAKGQMKHAARGRATTNVRVITEVSLIELYVMQVGEYGQRRNCFMAWADGVLVRNGSSLFMQAMQRAQAQVDLSKVTFRATETRHGLVRYDQKIHTVWFSRDLIPFPPHCLAYACIREMAPYLVAPDLEGEDRQIAIDATIHRGCPDWEDARRLLVDKDSPFRRQ